jgi:aminoglycoside phosphotransferase (APT) family kinase protein
MGREFTVLSRLAAVYDRAPRPYAYEATGDVLGAPFYLMERRHGVILRKEVPPALASDLSRARRVCELLVDALVDLHAVDYTAAGLGDFGKPAGYIERQVTGWSKRYVDAQTDDIPALTESAAWLASHMPAEVAPALIHNDFKFDNVIFDPELERITGVLDWEMATLGDPLMELGSMLAYWVQAGDDDAMHASRRQPTHLPGMFTREEFVARYAEKTGLSIGDWRFYEVYGLFRLAAVLQQLYRRYHDGATRNPAFKDFRQFVGYLDWRCREIIAKGKV